MESAQSKSRADYRGEALLWAIRSCAAVTTDILARHPHSAQLKKAAERLEDLNIDRSLSRLLWQELVEQEAVCLGARRGAAYVGPDQGTAAQFWQRRARLEVFQQRRAATACLPHPWPELMQMRAAAWRQVCVGMGVQMVAYAFAGFPLQRVIGMLNPLGSELAGQVVDGLRQAQSRAAVPAEVAKRWRDAYLRMARNVAGDRIASGLGRSLLAADYRRLADPARAAAAELCNSNVAEALQDDQFLEPVIEAELTLCQKITAGILSKGQVP